MFPRKQTLLAFFFASVHLAQAALVNRTIDSRFGDSETGVVPVYFPRQWTDETCPDCGLRPDQARAHRGTWAETTYVPPNEVNITMQFQGVAVYVFFILANNFGPDMNTRTEFNVTVDDDEPVEYKHAPGPAATFLYNQTVFSRTDLALQSHTIRIQAQGDVPAYLAFDYAIYTYDDSLDPPPSSSDVSPPDPSSGPGDDNGDGDGGGNGGGNGGAGNGSGGDSDGANGDTDDGSSKGVSVGVIVGAVIGGLAGLALLILLVLLFLRRRRRATEGPKSPTLEPDLTAYPYQQTPHLGAVDTASVAGSGTFYPTGKENSAAPQWRSDNSSGYFASTSQPAPVSVVPSSSGGDSASAHNLYLTHAPPAGAYPADVKRRLPDRPQVRGAGAAVSEGSSQGGQSEAEIAAMREQMSLMQQQIEILREQRADPLIADEPPPGYQPSASSR